MLVVSRTPCAEMCELARDDCHRWLHKNGFDWPTTFSCDKLPPRDGEQDCFYPLTSKQAISASREAITKMIEAKVLPPEAGAHMEHEDEFIIEQGNHPPGFKVSEDVS